MFDLTSSKLLLLGIVALLVVGPKDLPILLRTLGKYIGMIKRQAAEFRAQFDEAMRDAELQQLKQDVESLGQDTEKAIREGEQRLDSEFSSAQQEVDQAVAGSGSTTPADALTHEAGVRDADGALPPLPTAPRTPAEIAAAAAAPKSGA